MRAGVGGGGGGEIVIENKNFHEMHKIINKLMCKHLKKQNVKIPNYNMIINSGTKNINNIVICYYTISLLQLEVLFVQSTYLKQN